MFKLRNKKEENRIWHVNECSKKIRCEWKFRTDFSSQNVNIDGHLQEPRNPYFGKVYIKYTRETNTREL